MAAAPAWAKSSAKALAEAPGASAVKLVVAPVPKWVAPVASDNATALPRAALHYAVRDFQTKADASGVERFVHVVRVLDEVGGLESGAQIEVEFDPSFQKLVFHQLAVVRGNKRIDKLDAKRVKFLQRETQLERRMYDGRMTASVVLDDVRVGDRVEWSYSVLGENPVFKGRLLDNNWSVATLGPAALFQYRLVVPAQRAIKILASGPGFEIVDNTKAGQREVLVKRRGALQAQADPLAPASAYLGDVVQVTEFADWHDVATWADGLFAVAHTPSPAVTAQAREIAQASKSTEERVQRALDFVQKEVRYFGTEIGEGTHQPAAPETVLQQRFGDCKDKTVLLVALLNALGVEASPVLVSTYFTTQTGEQLPSPLAFNHAITRVHLGDRFYWLDGTRAYQTGALAGRGSTGLGQGLVAQASETGLTNLPSGVSDVRVAATSTIRVTKFSEDPILEARVVYYGEFAENVRAAVANAPVAELEKTWVNEYIRAYPGATPLDALQVSEIPQQNALALSMRYRLADYLKLNKQRQLAAEYYLVTLMESLRLPTQAPRTLPVRINGQGIYRESVDTEFPAEVFAKGFTDRFDERNSIFELRENIRGDVRSTHLEAELRLLTDTIPAAEWPSHLQRVQQTFQHFGGNMTVPSASPQQLDEFKARLATLSKEYDQGKYKKATQVQVRSMTELLIQDAQLASDRLPPKLRARTLIDRGINLDNLGRTAPAAKDLQEAIQIDPRNADAHSALAVNALIRGQYDQSRSEAAAALGLAPTQVGPRYTRVYANFFGASYADARAELVDILKDPAEVERSYASLWLYLTARRAGEDGAAAIANYLPSGQQPDWPYPVLAWLTNKIDFPDALAATKKDNLGDPNKQCELYFYAAQKYLADGNVTKAREYFQRSLDTGVIEFNEYAFSARELQRLKAQ